MTMRFTISLAALLGAVVLTGCSFHHSFPSDARYAAVKPPPVRVRMFTDINGTFYPNGWREFVDPARPWGADSLRNEADRRLKEGDDALLRLIESEEQRQLTEVSAVIAQRTRVFIFIHGFNNSQVEASSAFDLISDTIEFAPGDARIDFFWDGYVQGGRLSPLNFWFKAAGASQMAGTHGLRKILARLQPGQRAIMISHSRGASVALSSLSNPAYSAQFKAETRKLSALQSLADGDPLAPDPLRLLADRIDLVMLAPAVGNVDFWKSECAAPDLGRAGDCNGDPNPYREFPKALKSINYTINPDDPVLKKFVGLSHHFNPTDLGLHPKLGKALKAHYWEGPKLHEFNATWIDPTHAHPFACYATNDDFVPMLTSIQVNTRPPLALPANRRPYCKVKGASESYAATARSAAID